MAQEQELKANTELTRSVHTLTAEIHQRIVTGSVPTAPDV